MTELTQLAEMFKALGEPTRLEIFDFLRHQCCPVALDESGEVRQMIGPTVGEVCCHVTGELSINSKISHHIKELRLAELITVERSGKNMICGVNRESIATLVGYLSTEISVRGGNENECC